MVAMELGRDFMRALKQIETDKGLPMDVIISSIEAALVSAYKKYKGANTNVEVELDSENGIIKIFEIKEVVDTVKNPAYEISLEEARSLGFDVDRGETVKIEISPRDFGRIAAQTARQVIIQRLKDAERQIIYNDFSGKVGETVTGVVFRDEGGQVLVRIGDKIDAILPREERIPTEDYRPGDRKKFYVLDVRKTSKGPRIVLSRSHPGLLKNLLEIEVPEIKEGVIEIKSIAREAGIRSKVAVTTLDPNVDPVGACIGTKGNRIKAISDELAGERIDVIIWSSDPITYIKNALSPAKIVKVEPRLDEDKAVNVYVRPDQLSLAIGKGGQNVRLAAKLTGWKVDIHVLEPDRLPTLQDLFEDIIKGELPKEWEKRE
jgi:N utilization substance protein A